MPNQHHVLTESQQVFLTQLGFTRSRGLYLAGGTALALQMQHRRSVDFDFYASRHFQKGTLAHVFRTHLQGYKLSVIRDQNDTFELNVDPDIHLSCFYYRYPLLETPRQIQGVRITGLKDIAAMKMVAIAQRGRRRDFIDMYYLLQRFSLKEILRFTYEKYSHFDIYHGLRGLLYFEDADHDPDIERSMAFDRTLRWQKVKHFIVDTVKEFQKAAR